MEQERRRAIRIKRPLTIQYAQDIPDKNKIKWDTTIIKDISENGICITTTRCFSPKETITLLIRIPSKPFEPIEINGKVVESKPLKAAYGQTISDTYITRIEFTSLKEEYKELIRSYTKWILDKEKMS